MLHVKVEKKPLTELLTKAQSITYKKSTMVVLNNVLLYTKENELFIERTDLEISYKGKTGCEILEEGSITVPSRKIYELIREFPSSTIELIENENEWITIKGENKTEYKIGANRIPDFPKFPSIDQSDSEIIKLEANQLKKLIDKVLFSVSLDENKYSLSAVLIDYIEENGKKFIRTVGSDGHRLAYFQIETDQPIKKTENDILVPRKTANEIKKFVDGEKEIEFGFYKELGFIKSNNEELAFRLMDGKYPDYKQIIKYEKNRYFTINRVEFFDALKRISILIPDPIYRGILTYISKDNLRIELINKEFGEAYELIDIKYSGEDFSFAFNAKYMMDVLNVMESEYIDIVVNEGITPCIIEGENDPGFLGLIMPMTLEE